MHERRSRHDDDHAKLEIIERKLDAVFEKVFDVLLSRQKHDKEAKNDSDRSDQDRS